MKIVAPALAAGLALAAAFAGTPASANAPQPACAGAHCFFLTDRPATAAEFGIPAATGSIARLEACERWHADPQDRLLLMGSCTEGAETRSTETRGGRGR